MGRARLIRAAAGVFASAAVVWVIEPAPRASVGAARSEAAPMAVVLDVGDDRLRDRALATAARFVGMPASARAVAVLDASEGLVVVEDFTEDRGRALDAMRRLRARETWTYRHATTGTPVGDSLREVVADTARQGTPAHLVLLTELSEDRATARDYSALGDVAAAAGVAVHVIAYRLDDDREGSLLGANITSTTQVMQDCDPSRVACGSAEHVGHETRTARAITLGTMQRALSRLARDTGGRFNDRPADNDALLRQLSATPPPRAHPATLPQTAATWRTREANALAQLDRAAAVTMHIDGLETIRVPTDAGTRLVLAVAPSNARPGTAQQTFHVLRVVDGGGTVRAVVSAAQPDASTTEAAVHAVDLPPGPYMVEAFVEGGQGTQVERRLVQIETAETSPAGDLFFAARGEESGTLAAHPLSDQGRRFVPRASSWFRRSVSEELVAVLPMREAPAGMSLAVELVPEVGRSRRTVMDVPPRAIGQTVFTVMRLPLGDLPDGTYTLRVSPREGGGPWQRTRAFAVAP